MLTELTLTDLDSLRAEFMMALLNENGRKEIWKYDIIPHKESARLAIYAQNYDAMEGASKNKDKPYALIGPGIEPCYFGTVMELFSILWWLCGWSLRDYLVDAFNNTYKNQTQVLEDEKNGGYSCFIPFKK